MPYCINPLELHINYFMPFLLKNVRRVVTMRGEGREDLLLIREEQIEGLWGIGKHSQSRSGSWFYQCPLVIIC